MRFYGQFLVLLLDLFHYMLHYLVSYVVHMGTPPVGANRIHETNLFELTITYGSQHLPTVCGHIFIVDLQFIILNLIIFWGYTFF